MVCSLLHIQKFKGELFLIKYMKECRLHIENFIFRCETVKEQVFVRCRFSTLPRILGPASHKIKIREQSFVKVVLSLLSVGRTAKFKKSPDFSTILNNYTGTVDRLPSGSYIRFCAYLKKQLRIKSFKQPIFKSYHFSNKSSPLGKNSMESLLVELASLPPDILDCIYRIGGRSLEFNIGFILSNYRILAKAIPGYDDCIDKLLKTFKGNKDFINPVDRYDHKDPFFKEFLCHYIRKMSTFAEYEGKTRIIGLVDY